MRLWTYGEVRKKLERDFDLEDESFISSDELAGYCNEAIDSAEAEILKLNEDYFLRSTKLDLTLGQDTLTLPSDIYAQKIRSLIYNNGGDLIYEIRRVRDPYKFSSIAEIQVWGTADWYGYIVQNQTVSTQNTLLLVPPSKITASEILTLWYIRNAQRIPMLGEYFVTQDVASSGFDIATDIITSASHGYTTGDKVKISVTGSSTVPAGLTAGTIYYVIALTADTFALATTLGNARAGTKIDFTTAGSGTITFTVSTTEAWRDTVILDIPEFTSYILQFMKVRCYEKEPDPRYESAVAALKAHQDQMVNTLTEQVPDNDNKIPMDLAIYEDMS